MYTSKYYFPFLSGAQIIQVVQGLALSGMYATTMGKSVGLPVNHKHFPRATILQHIVAFF
jgi:hypothetical protein